MGLFIVQVKITNLFNEEKNIQCGMFVNTGTGAGALILPKAWRERLGEFKHTKPVKSHWQTRKLYREKLAGLLK